jgi:hypothetical protein
MEMTVPQLRRGVWRKKRRQRIQMESARFPRCAGAASGFRGIQLFFVDGSCFRSFSKRIPELLLFTFSTFASLVSFRDSTIRPSLKSQPWQPWCLRFKCFMGT